MIDEPTIWEHCEHERNGWLVIQPGASLIASGCTVSAIPLAHHTSTILVTSGAGQYVRISTLQGDGIDSYFMIVILEGGHLEIYDSLIRYTRDWGGNGDIQISGNGAIVENSTIVGNYIGIDTQGQSSGHPLVASPRGSAWRLRATPRWSAPLSRSCWTSGCTEVAAT